MALWQGKSNKKSTGGRLVPSKGKRKFEIGREKQYTKLGKQSLKTYRVCGGNVKVGMLAAEYANVVDKKTMIWKQSAKISGKSSLLACKSGWLQMPR